MSDESLVSLACAVLTVSDTRSAGDDTSGNLLAHSLAHAGHQCVRRDIVKDDIYQIRRIMSDWIADPEVQVILTTGGTGFSHRDHTPEASCPCWTVKSPASANCSAKFPTPRSAAPPSSRALCRLGQSDADLLPARFQQRLRNRLGADHPRAAGQ